MRWDPLLAAATARELSGSLGGSRVRALLLDSSSRRVLLFMRESTLALELHPLRGWVTLLPPTEPFPAARPLSARLRNVEVLPDESALVFPLLRIRGGDEGVELVAEMVGNRWNAFVVGQRTRTIRHALVPRGDRSRSLVVGSAYEPPPSTGRAGADRQLPEDAWRTILAEAGDDPIARRKALLRGVAWTSSLNVDALLGPDGWERWREITDPTGWTARLLETSRGPQPYPVALPGTADEPRDSLLEAFRTAREADDDAGPPRELLTSSALVDRGTHRLERIRGRLRGLRRELEGLADPEPIRATGNLILARLANVPKGAERVTLTDFAGSPVEVALDPQLAPPENAARYYREAARIERAQETLPVRVGQAEAEAREWSELLDGVRSGQVSADALAKALGPDRPQSGGGGGRQPKSLPYRRFTSSGGLEIRVGRGPRQNDELTFRHASARDVWLHARQAPGAHVILRWDRDESPPKRDLAEAAALAALNSDARHSGSVPVDWTRRKYVRKPRKSAPGAVLPERVETLFVEPDPALAERLRAEGSDG